MRGRRGLRGACAHPPLKFTHAIQYRHFHSASFADWHRFPLFVRLLGCNGAERNDWMGCEAIFGSASQKMSRFIKS